MAQRNIEQLKSRRNTGFVELNSKHAKHGGPKMKREKVFTADRNYTSLDFLDMTEEGLANCMPAELKLRVGSRKLCTIPGSRNT